MSPIELDRYCVIGHPVAHSKSPWIHARFAAATGQALAYDRLELPLDGFVEGVLRFRAGGGRGCNVTVPFKFEAATLPGVQLTPRALRAGAANTLRFDGEVIFADNTDGIGLVQDITRHAGRALQGARVLLVGAGGAGAGVMGPLLEAGPECLDLVNRSAERARSLAQRHEAVARAHAVTLQAGSLDEADRGYDIVINASASSLAGVASPVAARVLREGSLACDLMYGPASRPFLDWAAAHGAEPRDGLGMLVEQAAEAFALWRGVRPEGAPVLRELRELLEGT